MTINLEAFAQCEGLAVLDLWEGLRDIQERVFLECISFEGMCVPSTGRSGPRCTRASRTSPAMRSRASDGEGEERLASNPAAIDNGSRETDSQEKEVGTDGQKKAAETVAVRAKSADDRAPALPEVALVCSLEAVAVTARYPVWPGPIPWSSLPNYPSPRSLP